MTDGPTFTRTRGEVPGSPRRILRLAMDHVPHRDVALAAAGAARVLGLTGIADAWTGAANFGEETERWHAAADDTRRYLGKREPGPEVDIDEAVAKAMTRARQCGTCDRVYQEGPKGDFYLAALRCNGRCCLECLRRRLRRTTDRWGPLFAVPVRPGFRVSFVTIGSTSPVQTAVDVRGYLRRLGRVVRVMREGDERYGIPARSWVAGLRTLEVVPRTSGGFGHAHLLVVCRSWWPYGLHLAKLESVAAPAPTDLGFRALLRSLGCGEVFQDETVTTDADGAGAVGAYMRKVEKYVGKVERDAGEGEGGAEVFAGMPWSGREDMQRAMRGARLMDAFGDARGLLGGPDRMRRTRGGAPCPKLELRGIYDPADESTWGVLPARGAVEAGPDSTIERVTLYRSDTLDTWREWCDVDTLRSGMLSTGA